MKQLKEKQIVKIRTVNAFHFVTWKAVCAAL